VFEIMAAFITRMVAVDPVVPDRSAIIEAAALIRTGQLVAFPTETVYGLGADGLDATALGRVYAAKGRPADNPLILHVSDPDQLSLVAAEVPRIAHILIRQFWPGPLTLVLPTSSRVPGRATGGLATVAVRMPAHLVALALISASETPLAAPSANRSGRPSPTTAWHVMEDLSGVLPMILDGGPTSIGLESTVLDVTCNPPALLRPGGVTEEALEATIGPLQTTVDRGLRGRSPGTRYRHYSPKARVLVLEDRSQETFQRTVAVALANYQRVGCLLHRLELADAPPRVIVTQIGGGVADYAHCLFSALRHLDTLEVDVIIVEGVAEEGLGVAVMDRLRRAALPPISRLP
jgi:L-threonylcarbamoyladenylate synthase